MQNSDSPTFPLLSPPLIQGAGPSGTRSPSSSSPNRAPARGLVNDHEQQLQTAPYPAAAAAADMSQTNRARRRSGASEKSLTEQDTFASNVVPSVSSTRATAPREGSGVEEDDTLLDNSKHIADSSYHDDKHVNGIKHDKGEDGGVEDEADDDDLVAISGEDSVLRGPSYQQIGAENVRKESEFDRQALFRRIGINLVIIASWFFFSTLMNLYNSWLFSKKRKNFEYPLFTTSIHMIVQFLLSSLLMFLCRRNRRIVPRRRNGKRARPSGSDYASKVLPCALATALDIGLSNLSLKTITLTFYTMCKSSNLAFVLLFAFLFGLEKLRLSLIAIITLITIGVIMMVAAETEFVLEGAVEVLTASAMGGLRWALMQILLKRKAMGMSNPIATMFWLSLPMAGFMLFGSLVIESWSEMFNSPFFKDFSGSMQMIFLMILPGFIVFAMNLCEFSLIQRTSVMTLSVAGIFKEIMTIFISSTIFGDELTPINVTGLCIAISGIVLYNYFKYRLLMRNSKELGRSPAIGHGHGDDDSEEEDEEGGRSSSRYTELGGGIVSSSGKKPALNGIAIHNSAPISTSLPDAPARYDESFGNDSRQVGEGSITRSADTLPDSGDKHVIAGEAAALESERLRKREEEADLVGWHTSGFTRTGDGWHDGDSDDESEERAK